MYLAYALGTVPEGGAVVRGEHRQGEKNENYKEKSSIHLSQRPFKTRVSSRLPTEGS